MKRGDRKWQHLGDVLRTTIDSITVGKDTATPPEQSPTVSVNAHRGITPINGQPYRHCDWCGRHYMHRLELFHDDAGEPAMTVNGSHYVLGHPDLAFCSADCARSWATVRETPAQAPTRHEWLIQKSRRKLSRLLILLGTGLVLLAVLGFDLVSPLLERIASW